MATSGIRRKVDDLGRVVIPAAIRRSLGIREGDAVEVTVEGERIVLARPQDTCVFCGREDDEATTFRGRLVCRACVRSLGGDDPAPDAVPPSSSARPAAARAAASPDPTSAAADVTPSAPTGPDAAPAAAQRTEAPLSPPPWPTSADPGRRGPFDGDAAARAAAARAGIGQPVLAARRRDDAPSTDRPGDGPDAEVPDDRGDDRPGDDRPGDEVPDDRETDATSAPPATGPDPTDERTQERTEAPRDRRRQPPASTTAW